MNYSRIIFAGSPPFAAYQLKALIEAKFPICAVYTQPDRPAGRGKKLTRSAVAQVAEEAGLPIFQPENLKSDAAFETLAALKPELIVVAAYGQILPKRVLLLPPLGCINVHASLLPRWRGASPIQSAISAGDEQTGITLMVMAAGLDTGNLLYQLPCPVEPHDTGETLHDKLMVLGARSLLTVLPQLSSYLANQKPQDQSLATYAHKLTKEAAQLNWTESAVHLERLVRAYNPWPVATVGWKGTLIRVWEAKALAENTTALPGTLLDCNDKGLAVATSKDILQLLVIQLPGKRKMTVAEVLHGHPTLFQVGEQFL